MPAFPPDDQLDSWLLTAREAAEEAAAVHTAWAGRMDRSDASLKGDADWVSQVDLEAQSAALEVIRRHHPDHPIMAEEGDKATVSVPDDGTPIWIVDPLDGTTNYLHGHPMYASSVAVAMSGRVMAGAVTAPALGQRWWARRGGGAFRNGSAISVTKVEGLGGALVGTGFPFRSRDQLDRYADQLRSVIRAGAGVRRGGAAAVDLCYLADGRFDAFWELSLHPWDYAAAIVIIEEAGGTTGRVQDGPLGLEAGTVAGAGSAELLAELRRVVNG